MLLPNMGLSFLCKKVLYFICLIVVINASERKLWPGLYPSGGKLPNGGKIWAFLVAGSDKYYNYRHQADICHAYQLLHSRGVPDEQIIVMMSDDIAFNTLNPTKGVIINSPGGPNVYKGVPKDYTGIDVSPTNFLNVLSGNKTAMNRIGTGRVIESGPNDHIFVNFVDHGSPGMLCFPNEDLYADTLLSTIKTMADNKQFAKLVMYVEACYSGSMFDNLLPDNLNVFITTAADSHESSYACYYDSVRDAYLGDVFSVLWLDDAEKATKSQSLHHQFEKVRTFTNTSHVEEYGNLNMGATAMEEFIGSHLKGANAEPISITDAVNGFDVPVKLLENQIDATTDEAKLEILKLKRQVMIKKREAVDGLFEKILYGLTTDYYRLKELRESLYPLSSNNFGCYKQLVEAFSTDCMNISKNLYVRVHLQEFINMCTVSWISTSYVLKVLNFVCRDGLFLDLNVV